MKFVRLLLIVLIAGIPLGAYVPKRTLTPAGLVALERWADTSFPVAWRLNTTRGGNVSGSREVAEAFRQAFLAWSGVSTARVSFTEGATTGVTNAAQDGINLISLFPSSYSSDAPSMTVLYTVTTPSSVQFPGQILEADILLNPQALLSTDLSVPPDRYDLQSLAVHEIGHLLGLDHSGLVSAVMYPNTARGSSLLRVLSTDDILGISNLYPGEGFSTTRGSVEGRVRTPSGSPIFGAHVVVVDSSGKPIISTLTETDGSYSVRGLDAGSYSAYAEPIDGPLTSTGIETLGRAFPNQTPATDFTTRFAVTAGTTTVVTLTKTGGDNQTGTIDEALSQPLEVAVSDGKGNAVPGALVRFAATSGGGTVVPIQAATDAQGKARTTAYLGKGANQAFIAFSGSDKVTFTAGAIPPVISAITFCDPASNTTLRELTVNEGKTLQTPLCMVDNSGVARTGVEASYSSLSPDVATVDSTGLIRGVKAGFSTLTSAAQGKIATATITVVQVKAGASAAGITGVAQDHANRLYLASSQDHTIRIVHGLGQTLGLYAGVPQTPGFVNDVRTQSQFRNPAFLAFNQADSSLYVSDTNNNAIRRITPGSKGRVETLAGSETVGSLDGALAAARFNKPQGVVLDNAGNLWVADSGNHTIRRINLKARTVETVAGLSGTPGQSDGSGAEARFNSLSGIALEGETLAQERERFSKRGPPPEVSIIVADTGNGLIRRVRANGKVETLAANTSALTAEDSTTGKLSNSPAVAAQLTAPVGVAVDPTGNIFVTQPSLNAVKVILKNGDIVPAAQSDTFRNPAGIAITTAGRVVIADGEQSALEIRYGEPVITNTPARASNLGGERLTIQGSNFSPDTIVVVGGVLAASITVENTKTISFTTPVVPSGLVTLTVQNRGGLAQAPILVEPVTLSSLPVGHVTTVAGGSTFAGDGSIAASALLPFPFEVAVDSARNIYVTDIVNNRIRRIDAGTGVITTVAGNGVRGFSGDGGLATTASLAGPQGVAVDLAGNLYIADTLNSRIRKVSATTGIITTFAGNGQEDFSGDGGPASSAALYYPIGVAVDSAGNVYTADSFNDRVRKVSAATEFITTVAGNGQHDFSGDGGAATAASLYFPNSIALDLEGNLFIADTYHERIRMVAAGTATITTVAGSGQSGFSGDGAAASLAALSTPQGVAVDSAGDLYIADTQNFRVRKVTFATGLISTIAGNGQNSFAGDGGPASAASLYEPTGIVIDAAGNLIVADFRNNRLRTVNPATTVITTLSGVGQHDIGDNGPAAAAFLEFPVGVAVDSGGNLYIADVLHARVRRMAASTGVITTFAGNGQEGFSGDGGPATSAAFNLPFDVAIDSTGALYIADANPAFIRDSNNRIRKVSGGIVSAVAGTGPGGDVFNGDSVTATSAALWVPQGVAVDSKGNIYIADTLNNRVRKIEAGTAILTTIAGNGLSTFGGDGGAATSASLKGPQAVAVDAAGNLLIADTLNNRVRKITNGIITTIAGNGQADSSGDGGAAASAAVKSPSALVLDSNGNIFVAEESRIRKIGSTGIITTVAGSGQAGFSGDNGPATSAKMSPFKIAIDAGGNIYISDTFNQRIRAVRGPLP